MKSKFEFFIALRYLKARRKQTMISVVSLIAISGVVLGVAALIIVLAVMTGLDDDIKTRILGTRSHIVITKLRSLTSKGFIPDQELYDKVLTVPGVTGVAPFILGQVLVRSDRVQGIYIRGIDPLKEKNVSELNNNMIMGNLALLKSEFREGEYDNGTFKKPKPGIILGTELADRIGAFDMDDEVTLI